MIQHDQSDRFSRASKILIDSPCAARVLPWRMTLFFSDVDFRKQLGDDNSFSAWKKPEIRKVGLTMWE